MYKRYDTGTLSIEYLKAYQKGSDAQTVALLAGVYSDKEITLKALKELRMSESKAYLLETQLYMGCVH